MADNKNQNKKSDSQLKVEAKKESYVQGEEVKDSHLSGDPIEAGTKGDAIKKKLAAKKASRDDSGEVETDEVGRPVDDVRVYPHRLVQPHRIEQLYPETEVLYGALDEDKQSALSEAHSKGVEVDKSLSAEEIRSEIEWVDSERADALANAKPVVAQMVVETKTYHNNQMHMLSAGQLVYGDLAKEMLSLHAAEEVDGGEG
ncbi:MAG: hypothetical protein M3P49_09650 [Actinomycetota bacterium]|nr:hypothetical protein [Actinomycetota bacterium]